MTMAQILTTDPEIAAERVIARSLDGLGVRDPEGTAIAAVAALVANGVTLELAEPVGQDPAHD